MFKSIPEFDDPGPKRKTQDMGPGPGFSFWVLGHEIPVFHDKAPFPFDGV